MNPFLVFMAGASRDQVASRSRQSPDALVYGFLAGGARYSVVARGGVVVPVSKEKGRYLATIAAAGGGCVSDREALDSLYAEREDGGPGSSSLLPCERVQLRKLLEPLGLTIENRWGFGYMVVCVD